MCRGTSSHWHNWRTDASLWIRSSTQTLSIYIFSRKCTSVIPSLLVLLDNSKASTDPLLAGLVSAFVVVAAIMSVLLFLKFRNTNDGPEFRRLQDLPMVRLHFPQFIILPNTLLSNSHVRNIQRWQDVILRKTFRSHLYSSSFKKVIKTKILKLPGP